MNKFEIWLIHKLGGRSYFKIIDGIREAYANEAKFG